jgi:hypothetical protein
MNPDLRILITIFELGHRMYCTAIPEPERTRQSGRCACQDSRAASHSSPHRPAPLPPRRTGCPPLDQATLTQQSVSFLNIKKINLIESNKKIYGSHAVLQIRDVYPGSRIRIFSTRIHIKELKFLPIPDPGSRGQKGTGSRIRIRNTSLMSTIRFRGCLPR